MMLSQNLCLLCTAAKTLSTLVQSLYTVYVHSRYWIVLVQNWVTVLEPFIQQCGGAAVSISEEEQ